MKIFGFFFRFCSKFEMHRIFAPKKERKKPAFKGDRSTGRIFPQTLRRVVNPFHRHFNKFVTSFCRLVASFISFCPRSGCTRLCCDFVAIVLNSHLCSYFVRILFALCLHCVCTVCSIAPCVHCVRDCPRTGWSLSFVFLKLAVQPLDSSGLSSVTLNASHLNASH